VGFSEYHYPLVTGVVRVSANPELRSPPVLANLLVPLMLSTARLTLPFEAFKGAIVGKQMACCNATYMLLTNSRKVNFTVNTTQWNIEENPLFSTRGYYLWDWHMMDCLGSNVL
jgi:hypothetical protein